jgi:hypothetical protein
MNTYPEGSNVRFSVEFRTPPAGPLVDPTTVTFKIRRPDTNVVVTYTYPPVGNIIKDSTGKYHADYTCDFPGEWYYRWEGAGAYIGAGEKYVCIMETAF